MMRSGFAMANNKNWTLSKKLAMWLGSFIVIGFCMVYYFGMPLVPLLSVGVATLVVTIARHYLIKK